MQTLSALTAGAYGAKSAGSYGAKVQKARLHMAARLAVGGVDLYTAGATAFAPAESTLKAVMPWMSGVAAVGHAIYGIAKVATDTREEYLRDHGYVKEWNARPPKDYAVGSGHLITAAGFASLAFGLGPWALPIIAIGQATSLAGEIVGRDR